MFAFTCYTSNRSARFLASAISWVRHRSPEELEHATAEEVVAFSSLINMTSGGRRHHLCFYSLVINDRRSHVRANHRILRTTDETDASVDINESAI